jgi:ribosome-binding factor A
MESVRHERVRELLKRELGEIIRRELPAETAGLITVNDIGLAGDFKSATVFVGIIGNEERRRKGIEALKRERIRLQDLLGRSVVLRHTPVLRFELDTTIERGNRIMRIIEDLEQSGPPA